MLSNNVLKNSSISSKFTISNRKCLIIMAVPSLIFLFAFYYLPLFGWIYAFFDYQPGYKIFQCDFVGFKYFQQALMDPDIFKVIRNTLAISFLGLLTTPLPAAFAIMLSEMKSKRFQKFVQVSTTIPYFISWILVYSIFFLLFSVDGGLINNLLTKSGIMDQPYNLLADNRVAWLLQTGIGIWKGLGFSSIMYFAAIAGIDQELYHAANVDGAGRWRSMLHITIPGLVPTYITLLLIQIGNMLSNGFDQFYVFNNALVQDKLQVLDLYLYNVGFYLNDYPLSTALGIFKIVVSILLLFIANWISKRLRGQSIL